jgi:putative transposase
MNNRPQDPTDLTDAEWSSLEPHVPAPTPGGRPRAHPVRESFPAIFSVRRRGCAWRLLPHALPPGETVYQYGRRWRLPGLWGRRHPALRAAGRLQAGREPQPRAGILDSQSVTTPGVGGVRGHAGAKQLRGRTRHLLVDTHGLARRAKGHSAAVQDRAAGPGGLEGAAAECPRLEQVWVAQGDTGRGKAGIAAPRGGSVEVVGHPPKPRGVWAPSGAVIDWEALRPQGLRGVRPRRWGIERTSGWFGPSRRLSKDDERLCATRQARIYATMIRLMLRRLAHA